MLLLLCLLGALIGCAYSSGRPAGVVPERIGESLDPNVAGLDAYETALVGLFHHMDDAIAVLTTVDDVESARAAAEKFEEAADLVVALRLAMEEAKPNRSLTAAEVVVKYGPRYLTTRFAIEEQFKRIKAIGPEVYEPIKAVLVSMDEKIKQSGVSSPTDP